MKLIILLAVCALSKAAKLDRTYLPPTGAGSAGGSPGALQAPSRPGAFPQGTPAFANTRESFGAAPTPKYGPPSAGNFGKTYNGAASPSQTFRGANAPSHGINAPSQSNAGNFNAAQGFNAANIPSQEFNAGFNAANQATAPNGNFNAPNVPSQGFNVGFNAANQATAPNRNFNAANVPSQGFNAGFNAANQAPAHTGHFNAPQGLNAVNLPSQGFNRANIPSQGFNGQFNTPNQANTPTGNFNAPAGFNAGATAYNQPERAQAAQERSAQILRQDFQNDGETFAYSFETSNGISAEENGVATNGVQAQGAFSYTGDDGQVYSVTYTADENGYQPHGYHLPTPPPIPDVILRSIELNRAAEAAGTIGEGDYNEQYNRESTAEQYNAPSGPATPRQQYGAPQQFGSVGVQGQRITQHTAPRPDSFSQQTRPQFNAPSQQYGALAQGSSQKYFGPQQYNAPSQQYNTPTQQFNGQGVSGPLGTTATQANGPQQYNAQRSSGTSQQYGSTQQNAPRQFRPQAGSQQYNGQAASARGSTPSQQYGEPSQSGMSREQYNSAPYSYNSPSRGVASRPGVSPNGPSQSGGTSQFNPLATQTFNGTGVRPNAPDRFSTARQPPSFSQQDGYKY